MADSEKLTALKKAYAEIILNTAKEAAAKIIVSEKKAVRYQEELLAAKDEALRMLVRLKQMLDAKASEVEVMSQNQQKRIENLEAQLGEAEDIVRDLREELREAQHELEKRTRSPMQCSGKETLEHDAQTGMTVSENKCSLRSGTSMGSTCSCKDNCYVCNPDFPSIVMRRKEPDLYRNGCTQRIRALERCLLNKRFSRSGQVDDAKNENTGEYEEGKDMHTKVPLRVDMCRPEEETDKFKVMQTDVHNMIQALPLIPFRRKRKRAARYKKNIAPSSMDVCYQVAATCQESNLLFPESSSHASDENAQVGDHRMIDHNAIKGSHSPSIPGSPSGIMKVVTELGYGKVDKDDKLLTDQKGLVMPNSGSSENLGVASYKPDPDSVDVYAVNTDVKSSEVIERSSTNLVNNKFLVYTFKRKRKKDSLSSPDRYCSLDDDNSKRKTEDKQDGSLGSEMSTLTTESSRDICARVCVGIE